MNNTLVELEMQELEAMDAPGFFTGLKDSVLVGSAIVASIAYT